MAGDDVTITIRANNGDAIRAFRDVNGQLRDMRGRFVSDSSVMTRSMNQLGKSVGNLKGYLIPLATAGVPVIASLGAASVKTAGSVGGATLAVAAFGVALAGQVSHLSDASKAQTKYTDAVAQYGRGSKQAAEAQRQVSATLASMPAATQRAAVGWQTLKQEYRAFSDSTAKFTMAPVEKSFAVMGQLLPKLTPMVEGTSTQLDRLVSVAGGAVASPGFDAYADRVADFANDSLKGAVDGAISLGRALSEGEADGPIAAFMDYAEANGPAVREALSSIGSAVTTLLEASADAGPGMLTLVTAAAELVAALPPELVATVMQLAVGLKLVTLAGAGAAAISGGIAALGTKIAALQAASVAAGGGMAGLAAAFGTLGKAAKASIIVAGIAALVVAVEQLSSIGDKAPPNVDKLTTSLGNLGRTGKATGYVAEQFGKDFGKLKDQIDKVTSPSVTESINNWGADITGGLLSAGDATEEFTKSMDSIDEALTSMVKGGKAELAKAALASMTEGMSPEQAKKFRGELDGYDQALADMALEAKLTAESMGIFGAAAADTSATLSAQQQAADGLRASILALNDANRSAHDAQIGFEQGLDDLTASFKEHGSTLNIDTEAGRANATAMSQAAAAQDELIASGLAAGESLGSMTKKSDELRETMMRLATDAFDGNKQKATDYVNTLLGMPGEIKTLVKLEREEAIAGLESVRAAIRETPDAKKVTVSTLNGAAIAALEAVGLKTKQLPDGKTAVFTANGQALGGIGAVSTALNNLDGKTATTTITTNHVSRYVSYKGKTIFEGSAGRMAAGGPIEGGSGIRDDVPILAMGGEYVINKKSTEKYGPLLEAINEDRLPRFARGGKVSTAMRDARNELRDQFGISHFGQRAGYSRTPFEKALGAPQDLGGLVSALNAARGDIKRATSGGTESRLLKMLNSVGSGLIKYEKNLTKVNASLEKARDKLDSLKSAASQLRDSVKSGVLSAANITRGASGDKPMTVRSIMGGLVQSRDKATAFADALQDLTKKGLSKDLIRQIAEAGIEGGGLETAGALLRASASEIASLNDLQSQIAKAAGEAGKTTADALYGAAIRAQEKLISSLKKQQDSLEKAMDRLAKTMEKAIKRAIGGKAAGGIIGAAAGGGPRGGLTWVGEQGPELVRLPYGSMVHSNPDSRRMAAAGAGSGVPVVVNLSIGNRDFGQLWIDTGRKQVKAYGGLQAALVTR